jgi:OmcA/MtrC family decaheme c-type cytochrome
MAGSLALAGCSGDDGDMGLPGSAGQDGINGTNGSDGQPGQDGDDGAAGVDGAAGKDGIDGISGQDGATKLLNAHAVSEQVKVSNVVATPGAANVVITFNVKVDGANTDKFVVKSGAYRYAYVAAREAATVKNAFERFSIAAADYTVVSNGAGNYTVTVNGAPPAGNTTYMINLYNAASGTVPTQRQMATAVANLNAPARSLTSDQACVNCHGDYIFRAGSHHGANPPGPSACVVCHTRYNSSSRGIGGDRLTAYVHGIHNSHNMPGEGYDRTFPVPNPKVNDFEVTYPTYMQNCSVCHDTPETLAAVNNAPVSYSLCMSCHDSWEGFSFSSATAAPFKAYHLAFTPTQDCTGCHKAPIPSKVADFHNNRATERAGVIFNGVDTSVVEGAKVDVEITGITRSDNNLLVNWTAKFNGNVVDPCNAVATTTAPTFHAAAANATTGQVAGGFSILRAYAEGDDFSNPGIGTAPGQPVSTNLTTSNTACVSNVATSTIALSAEEQAMTRGRVAIQGKAQLDLSASYPGIDSNATATGAQPVDQVRSKSPTREFMVSDGNLPTTLRRQIVDTMSCLKCHVGSLYQHGGNRVDNVDLCVMCHNEASSEKNVRTNDGVDATEAYDGKTGQTYGFKSLLHAVHSAGVNGAVTMVYRTNGVYVWAGHDTVIPNWPGTGSQVVYGSNNVTRTHNLHSPTYPQTLKNCQACHKPGTEELPDQSKAVATTLDAGVAPWANQLDDTLQGPAMAACMSCHSSNELPIQAGLQAHAKQFGWAPTTSTNGRADFLNYSRGVETCYFCHK